MNEVLKHERSVYCAVNSIVTKGREFILSADDPTMVCNYIKRRMPYVCLMCED